MADRRKTFSFPWGSGVIAEEAQAIGEHHKPTLQLMEYTDGDAKGMVTVRFCTYSHGGRFSRSPLVVSSSDIHGLRAALRSTPRLRALLKRLLE